MSRRSSGRRTARWRLVVAAVVVPVLIGIALAGTPLFFLGAPPDIAPPGPACGFEHDPGSGASAMGVERVEWSFIPVRSCVPIGGPDLPTAGPEFDAAAARSLGKEVLGGDFAATERALLATRTTALYAEVWVVVAGLVTVGIWVVIGFVAWRARVVPSDAAAPTELSRMQAG